jgi:hypothetical protein
MPRNDRAALLRDLQSSAQDALDPATPPAGLSATLASLQGLEALLKT